MTTLTLTHLTVAPAGDPTDLLMIAQYSEGATLEVPSEVRRYAGGRDRLITRPGSTRSITLSFRFMERDDYNALEALSGQLVIVRDQRGRVVWGVLTGVSGSEWIKADRLEEVSVTLTSASWSEVV